MSISNLVRSLSVAVTIFIGATSFAQEWTSSKTLLITHSPTINQLYQDLIGYERSWYYYFFGNTFFWSSSIGQLSVGDSEANDILATLKGWDLEDGNQDGSIAIKLIDKKLIRDRAKVELTFFKIEPSQAWKDNQLLMRELVKNRQLLRTIWDDRSFANLTDIDQAAATATFAGFTPNLLTLGLSMADASSNVRLYYSFADIVDNIAVSLASLERLEIRINLRFTQNENQLKNTILHEYGHQKMKIIAMQNGHRRWASWVFEKAAQSQDPKTKDAAALLDRFMNTVDEQTANRRLNQISYNLEEMTDTEIFRCFSDERVKIQSQKWESDTNELLGLSDTQFAEFYNYQGMTPGEIVSYLGREYHRGRASGAPEDLLKKIASKHRKLLDSRFAQQADIYTAFVEVGRFIQNEFVTQTNFCDEFKSLLPEHVFNQVSQ